MEDEDNGIQEDEYQEDAESGEVASPQDQVEPDGDVDWRAVRGQLKDKDETIKRNEQFIRDMAEREERRDREMYEMKQSMLNQNRARDEDSYQQESYSNDEDDDEMKRLDKLIEARDRKKKQMSLEQRNADWRAHVRQEKDDFFEVCSKENIDKLKQRRPRLFASLDVRGPDTDVVQTGLALYEAVQAELQSINGDTGKSGSSDSGSNIDRLMQTKAKKSPPSALGNVPKSGSQVSGQGSQTDLMAEVMRCMR